MAVLGTLLAFASISTDLYLSAIPGMSAALAVTQKTLQYTVSGYLIGFSIGQLFWGPIGDRYGRRIPVAIGLLFFLVGSAGCALSTDIVQLISCRVLQAVGACASVVLGRAMAVAPLLGPSVGGLILRVAAWQAIFWTIVLIGFLALAALFTLLETLPPERRNGVCPRPLPPMEA